jgi:WD40 repeat protein
MATSTVIISGTYEGGVVGFEAKVDVDGSVHLEQIISTPCHIGCVRAIGSAGRYAITGGTDEMISVFDVIKRLQLGNMGGSVHTSTITALAVCDKPDLLVSGCEDGQIAITRIKDFQTLRSFKGHKSAVLDLAIHPSGKIALSVSSDSTLRMWDLTRGTCAAVRTITKTPGTNKRVVSTPHMVVKYTPQGTRYALLLQGGDVEICSSTSMDVASIAGPYTTIVPVSESIFVTGDSKGVLRVLKVNNECTEVLVTGELSSIHNSRLRGIARLGSPVEAFLVFATVCAEGKIAFSKINVANGAISEIRSFETGMRITCFTSNA